MPRRPRTHLDHVPLHIVQRGHNRDACFFADDDYAAYLHWLAESLRDTGCRLHAWVLMTNHVHLLLTPDKAKEIPNLLISLGRRYVQYINRTYRRTGTLWDGRYKSSLIDADAYLLTCMRYIELNPVRAGIVDDPAHYRWSSYRHNGLGQPDPLINPHPLYTALATQQAARLAYYRALFRTGLDKDALDDIRLALAQSLPLGSSRFHADIAHAIGEPREARPRGRPRKVAECRSAPAAIQAPIDYSDT